ncbi:hypothetical protein [Actinomadura litoris]|uniref:hypothetical protein n=1 Tax=Actinomadura litoris TaxID=2678616 RepID=UPI001FA78516|nr:hypothetical protein [Actinomadura litoris]
MTSPAPDEIARARLDQLMDTRRAELRLRWKDVAARAGLTTEGLRNVRGGRGEIRSLTKRGIEEALGWTSGSIDSILGGGEPTVPGQRIESGIATETDEALPIQAIIERRVDPLVDPLADLPDDAEERIPVLRERIRILTETLEKAEAASGPVGSAEADDAALVSRLPGPLRDALRDGEVQDYQLLDVSDPEGEGVLLIMRVGPRPSDEEIRRLRQTYSEHRRRREPLRDLIVKRQAAWGALVDAEEAVEARQAEKETNRNGKETGQ